MLFGPNIYSQSPLYNFVLSPYKGRTATKLFGFSHGRQRTLQAFTRPFIAITNSQLLAVQREVTIQDVKTAMTCLACSLLLAHRYDSVASHQRFPINRSDVRTACRPAGTVYVLHRSWHAHGWCKPTLSGSPGRPAPPVTHKPCMRRARFMSHPDR